MSSLPQQSSADNCFAFASQLLACYWALLEINIWQWGTKLPCNLSCLLWAGCYLPHQVIKLDVHNIHLLANGSGTYVIGPEGTNK